ncbi:MAG: hypothetical protein O3A63_06980 [Proteobacteria bacterium]|nr:hypothetical protein [Pseudomonadota bacterium]
MTKKLLVCVGVAVLFAAGWLFTDAKRSPEAVAWMLQSGADGDTVNPWLTLPATGIRAMNLFAEPEHCAQPDCFAEYRDLFALNEAVQPPVEEPFWDDISHLFEVPAPQSMSTAELARANEFLLRWFRYRLQADLLRNGVLEPGQLASLIEDHRRLLANANSLPGLVVAVETLTRMLRLTCRTLPHLVEAADRAALYESLRPIEINERGVRGVLRGEYGRLAQALDAMDPVERFVSIGKPGLFLNTLYSRFQALAEVSELDGDEYRRTDLPGTQAMRWQEWLIDPRMPGTIAGVLPALPDYIGWVYELDAHLALARRGLGAGRVAVPGWRWEVGRVCLRPEITPRSAAQALCCG